MNTFPIRRDGEESAVFYFTDCVFCASAVAAPGVSLLCTSSRDRVIHVFAPRQDYSRVQTLADHSGVVNSALFFESEETRRIYLISCGADRSLLFRILSVCSPPWLVIKAVLERWLLCWSLLIMHTGSVL